jgi:hypothetical protein
MFNVYASDDPNLLQPFTTLLAPSTPYILAISMDAAGVSSYLLLSGSGEVLETQTVQHATLCADNYYEGAVQGLYFGGNCRAPEEVGVQYSS